jgi:hypothetical protein
LELAEAKHLGVTVEKLREEKLEAELKKEAKERKMTLEDLRLEKEALKRGISIDDLKLEKEAKER